MLPKYPHCKDGAIQSAPFLNSREWLSLSVCLIAYILDESRPSGRFGSFKSENRIGKSDPTVRSNTSNQMHRNMPSTKHERHVFCSFYFAARKCTRQKKKKKAKRSQLHQNREYTNITKHNSLLQRGKSGA